jgi:hypothetical protein
MASPVERTMKSFRERGFDIDIAERYCAYSRRKNDLFGIIDLVAIKPMVGIIGIQCCGKDYSEHDKKILSSELSLKWIRSTGILELWGWRKLKVKRGGKAVKYQPRVKRYSVLDFK